MTDMIVIIVIVTIVFSAIAKIVIEKRKGAKCVGCPYSQAGSRSCGCSGSK